jgi:ribosomal protein L24E
VNPYTSQSFMLTVNEAPVITSADATTFTVGAEGSFQLTASGVPDPTFYEVGPLPIGVTLSADGLLSGTPATGSGGVYPIEVNATNDVAPVASQSFTLTVDAPPVITSADATTFTVGTMGSLQMTASGTPGPTFSETGPLPTGVTLTTQGLLSGTPAAGTVGIYMVTVNATNTVAPDANQTFTLMVNEAPTITSVASTTFTVGTTGSFQVTATGGPDPTFSETGVLPTGVTLTGDGLLSGRPAASTGGSYPITIHAGNGVDPDASQTFTLTVDQAPVITSADATSFTLGTVGSFQVTASGTPSPTYSETGDLPNGVTLTTAGLLSGTPATGTGGDYTVTISGANGVAPGTTQTFTLTVTLNPVITSVDATTFTLGTAGSFRVTATGSPTFSETGALPSGVALASDGDLSGTPGVGTTGTYPLTITASSAVLPNGTQHFTLTVDQRPAITSVDGTTFTVGSAGSFQVTGTGTPGPTFSEAGALPSGVSLTAAGLLSGTPATGSAGSYPLTISASNGLATGATQSFTLSVDNSAVIPPVAGSGYWMVASDGGIFSFGSAKFYGSMGGTALNKPIVGMVATPNGQGYWMVASDGGIFSFGSAKFYGSMGGKPLNQPIVGLLPSAGGGGNGEVASDGGLFSFGDFSFFGSMGGQHLNEPIVGAASS